MNIASQACSTRWIWLVALCVLVAGNTATAQTYSIDWFKLAGGGGTSTSGVYSISATIAQHDAGPEMTNRVFNVVRPPIRPLAKSIAANSANYTLISGFWAIYALQTPGAPGLRILLTATNTAIVAWPAPSTGWSLQVNSDLRTSNWQLATQSVNVVGGENQVVVLPFGESFFRLHFSGP